MNDKDNLTSLHDLSRVIDGDSDRDFATECRGGNAPPSEA